MAATKTSSEPSGEIRSDAVYTLDAIKRTLGLGGWALRQAQRDGLAVRKVGRRKFVTGKSVIDYLERTAEGDAS